MSRRVIAKYGGVAQMSRRTGIPSTTLRYWWDQDRIPSKRIAEIRMFAGRDGVDLSADDFFGGSLQEVGMG
jgi:hypothetical protein